VGRSAAAKALTESAVGLAVVAHIRHEETDYDMLLARGTPRFEARHHVREAVERVVTEWLKR
jgi:hypothetical protein